MVIVRDGKLTIPLYHGTSSLFVSSIVENGLGAIDPVRDFEVIPFMKNLYEVCQQLLASDPSWLSEKWLVEKMMNQELGFRHGGTFLSPSRLTAVRYAISNAFGSEIISTAARLYKILTDREPEYLSDQAFRKSPAITLMCGAPYPVLAEALDVDLSYLEGEHGERAKQVIERLSSLLSKLDCKHLEAISQQSNFQLIKPLGAHWLRLYEIRIIESDPIFPRYDLIQLTH